MNFTSIASLMSLGILGLIIGKFGFMVSLIAWILGILSLIPYVSFWFVSGFALTWIIGFISTAVAYYNAQS